MRNLLFTLLVLAFLTTPADLFAQFGASENTKTELYTDPDAGTIKLIPQYQSLPSGAESALALQFKTKGQWHYYADKKQIPTGKLSVTPSAENITFGDPVYPEPIEYDDKVFNKKYGIYKGDFKVYIPFKVSESAQKQPLTISVKIDGAVCAELCKFLDEVNLQTTIQIDPQADLTDAAFKFPTETQGQKPQIAEKTPQPEDQTAIQGPSFSMPIAFALALIAGLLLNVMPCVWPIIPIIITRLWNLSGESRGKSAAMGIAFSIGILLFFAIIATANIILQVSYDEVLQWGDFNRKPAFNIGLSLLMLVMGLFMFGVFQFTLPASVSGKASSGQGLTGAIGMGFLMALLSTPCGFGIGMALPYIFLTSIPGLLNNLPKPGGWMDHVKFFLGFLMLLIAVKILSAVPDDMIINTLYFAVFLSLAVWMWGWVTSATTPGHKIAIRTIAIIIAVTAGWLFLAGAGEKPIDWLEYDQQAIAEDIEEEKPVLIKFTADWCTTCTIIDRLVYKDKDIAELLKQKGVKPYLADTTGQSQATTDLKEIYKEPAIPVTVIHLPGGEEKHLKGMFTKGTLREILKPLKDVKAPDGKEDSRKNSKEDQKENTKETAQSS